MLCVVSQKMSKVAESAETFSTEETKVAVDWRLPIHSREIRICIAAQYLCALASATEAAALAEMRSCCRTER